MKYSFVNSNDQELVHRYLDGFIPESVFDIHAHIYQPDHFPTREWAFLDGVDKLGVSEMRQKIRSYMPVQVVRGLYFGLPRLSGDREKINDLVAEELDKFDSGSCRGLILASPRDTSATIASRLQGSRMCGLKVYHCYADRPDTMNASIPEYAPEWMWEILDDFHGVLMLHIVRDQGIADEDNIRQLRRLCRNYPRVKVVLAHISRSFNYRTAVRGLHHISDLDNVVVDTSAICESQAFTAAIEALGPRRILWGSDFPVSEMRGRCITVGDHFFWLHPEVLNPDYSAPTRTRMTLVGIESLIALKEACADQGLTGHDVEDIFYNNALRLLANEERTTKSEMAKGGPGLWAKAREVISGGTALLSKQAGARAYSGKSGIVFCGYHGWHDWYLSANLNESTALDGHLIPGLAPVGVPRQLQGTSFPFLYNNVASFDQAIDKLGENVAAIVMEPMRSQYPKSEFIQHIVRVCREKDIVLIVDEITSGLRFGYPGAHRGIDLSPDIVVYAKAMSNGVPFGAVVGRKEVMERSEHSFISSSYWTDGLGTSAALAVLDKMEKLNVQEKLWDKGLAFQEQLSQVASRLAHFTLEVGGMPVSPTLTFGPAELARPLKAVYIRKMMEQGFLASTYIYLMHAHSQSHLEKFVDSFGAVLDEMDELVKTGKLRELQGGVTKNREGFSRLT